MVLLSFFSRHKNGPSVDVKIFISIVKGASGTSILYFLTELK